MLQRPIQAHTASTPPSAPRDLVDFHLRWAEYRPQMIALQGLDGLSPQQVSTLGWLIALSDRISEQDII